MCTWMRATLAVTAQRRRSGRFRRSCIRFRSTRTKATFGICGICGARRLSWWVSGNLETVRMTVSIPGESPSQEDDFRSNVDVLSQARHRQPTARGASKRLANRRQPRDEHWINFANFESNKFRKSSANSFSLSRLSSILFVPDKPLEDFIMCLCKSLTFFWSRSNESFLRFLLKAFYRRNYYQTSFKQELWCCSQWQNPLQPQSCPFSSSSDFITPLSLIRLLFTAQRSLSPPAFPLTWKWFHFNEFFIGTSWLQSRRSM